jgi:hypothetical protein
LSANKIIKTSPILQGGKRPLLHFSAGNRRENRVIVVNKRTERQPKSVAAE